MSVITSQAAICRKALGVILNWSLQSNADEQEADLMGCTNKAGNYSFPFSVGKNNEYSLGPDTPFFSLEIGGIFVEGFKKRLHKYFQGKVDELGLALELDWRLSRVPS